MALKSDRYIYKVVWSDEDRKYMGLCVEFPDLSFLAMSPESALRGIRKLAGDVSQDMMDNGESSPDPLSDRKFSGKFVVRIPAEVHRKLSIEAEEEGISLNRLVSAKLSR